MLESVPDDISNAKYYAKYIDYLKNSLTSNDHFYSSCSVFAKIKQLSGENKDYFYTYIIL